MGAANPAVSVEREQGAVAPFVGRTGRATVAARPIRRSLCPLLKSRTRMGVRADRSSRSEQFAHPHAASHPHMSSCWHLNRRLTSPAGCPADTTDCSTDIPDQSLLEQAR